MQIDTKAAVMLFVTLVLGIALGALGAGALSRQRNEQVQQLRRAPGFVAHMEEVIQPRDSAQRAMIQPVLTATAARNDSILHGTTAQLRARYAEQYVKLNNEKKVDKVNPDAVALYVRNVFASQAKVGNDEKAFAKTVVALCKSR